MLRRIPVGLTLAVAIAFVILCGLGAWQIKRLRWKEDLLARVAALQHAPARPLAEVLARAKSGEDVNFTRVSLDCPGLGQARFLELYALKGGQSGVRLISACPATAAGYGSVLVDRGFIPDTAPARPAVGGAPTGPVTLTGVLRQPDPKSAFAPERRPGEARWYYRDAAGMAAALGAGAPAPYFLMAETSSNPELPALEALPVPADISNRHLQYVVTWFGLAAALLAVYAGMLWRRLHPKGPA